MISLKYDRSPEDVPLTWRKIMTLSGYTASIACYKGHYSVLYNHTINKNGEIHPSVVCPREGCDFHEYIKLEDWVSI